MPYLQRRIRLEKRQQKNDDELWKSTEGATQSTKPMYSRKMETSRQKKIQLSEKILYQMPRFVEMFVVVNRLCATRLTGNHRLNALCLQHRSDSFLRVIGLIG